MPISSIELTRLTPTTFEHLVNSISMSVLGAGHTGFGPGPDGGRDGFFEGTAPYPSTEDRWSGRWYIQSKFRGPTTSGDPQKWLLKQIQDEISEYEKPGSAREWPDIWIVATNIDPTAVARTGTFDKARALLRKANPNLAKRFHIWGGQKILTYLSTRPQISEYYAEFVTPGQVLSRLFDNIGDERATVKNIVRYLTATQFVSQQHTKLEQAGSAQDSRPGIDQLFTDLPWSFREIPWHKSIAESINFSSARPFRNSDVDEISDHFTSWMAAPQRSRIWFVKGGPGQGKSTITQYLAQVNRAALILTKDIAVAPAVKQLAKRVQRSAQKLGIWPDLPRIPVTIELRQFAHWFGRQSQSQSREILAYLVDTIGSSLSQPVLAATFKRALQGGRWLIVLDGLDEVPGDVKDSVANAINYFVNDLLVECDSDAVIVCTSRPQGYSGQFDQLGATVAELAPLGREKSLQCATPVLEVDRSPEEAARYVRILTQALDSPAVREIMTTPLQSHIMAVVIRDGGRPPEKKWELFTTFYQVIKRREANRDLPDPRINALLREGDKLLKVVHNRLGFELHKRAETSEGAQTSLTRAEFETVVRSSVLSVQEHDVEETVSVLMEATTDRLVLVTTPENGDSVRFDIRPLQEFFAAEYIYEGVGVEQLAERLAIIVADSHWREVMHFLLSALVTNERKGELAVAVQAVALVDESSDPPGRAVRRRLAVGGLMTARLAREGVLEDDKKMRALFRNCLSPIMASTDVDRYLADTRSVHTRRWLTDFVIDTFLEQAETEALGTPRLLLELVDDQNERTAAVAGKLRNSTEQFFCFFVAQVSETPWERAGKSPTRWPVWLAREVFQRLSGDNWPNVISHDRDTLNYFARSPSATVVLREEGLTESAAKSLLSTMHDLPFHHNNNIKKKWGILEVYEREVGISDQFAQLSDAEWSQVLALGGVFQMIASVAALILKRPSAGQNLELLTTGKFLDFWSLPVRLRDHFDMSAWKAQTEPCGASRFFNDTPESSTSFFASGDPINPDFESFVREMPLLALNYAVTHSSEPLGEGLTTFLGTPEGICAFQEATAQMKTSMIRAVAYWGSPQPTLAPILSYLRQSSSGLAAYEPNYGAYFGDVFPFTIDLPREAHLLPLLLDMCSSDRSPSRVRKYGKRHLAIADLIAGFSADKRQLSAIWSDKSYSPHIRLAALGFYLANKEGCSQWEDAVQQIGPLFRSSGMASFAMLIAELFEPNLEKLDGSGVEILGVLMEATRNDLPIRTAMAVTISGWREIERAPVTASDVTIWQPH